MKKIGIIVFLLLSLVVTGCHITPEYFLNSDPINFNEKIDADERDYWPRENSLEVLLENYSLEIVTNDAAYMNGDTINVNFYIDTIDDFTRQNANSIANYFSHMFIERRLLPIGLYNPYAAKIVNDKIDYNVGTVRVYTDDQLLLYYSFDRTTKAIDYFENLEFNLESRKHSEEKKKLIDQQLEENVDEKVSIVSAKLFKENVDYIGVKVTNKMKDMTLKQLKDNIETLYDSKNSLLDDYPIGVVLGIYDGESIDEYTYFNGTHKEWVEDDWKTFRFTYYELMN